MKAGSKKQTLTCRCGARKFRTLDSKLLKKRNVRLRSLTCSACGETSVTEERIIRANRAHRYLR